MKEILEVTAAIVGLITAVIPLVARFFDRRRRAARLAHRAQRLEHADRPPTLPSRPSVLPLEHSRPLARQPVVLELADEPEDDDGGVTIHQRTKARQLVKGPGIALIAAGSLGMCLNLIMAGGALINQFVTPLGSPRGEQQGNAWPYGGMQPNPQYSDETNAILTSFVMVCLSIPCAMAIWAGVNMIRLRSYWLSVAGSIAVMPGACCLCMLGLPIGIWALVILFRPEVSAAFI